jgi:hypothetical protein
MTTSALPSPPPDFRTRLDVALSRIQVPELHDCAWIGPFEQLVGASFSLIESEKRGFLRGHLNYHPAVQRKIVSLLAELEAGKESTDKEALENWLSRYYFNCGIQRVNFAAERLIATFAALSCSCGGHPPQIPLGTRIKFRDKLKGAKARVAHVETEYSGSLVKVKEVFLQLGAPYNRYDPFNPAKGLAMLRQDVNSRKHSPYKRSETLDSLPTPSSGTVNWADAGFLRKMEIAVTSLELVGDAYAESIAWFPQARL